MKGWNNLPCWWHPDFSATSYALNPKAEQSYANLKLSPTDAMSLADFVGNKI